jgi:hypothetical protein
VRFRDRKGRALIAVACWLIWALALPGCDGTSPTPTPFRVAVSLRPGAQAIPPQAAPCVVVSVNPSGTGPIGLQGVAFTVDNQCGAIYMGFAYESSTRKGFLGCSIEHASVETGPSFRLEAGQTTVNCAVNPVGCGKVQVKIMPDFFVPTYDGGSSGMCILESGAIEIEKI